MIIVNADDWGRSIRETDVIFECQRLGTITSVSAMVFMDDSKRAARIALGSDIDVGLHLNLNQEFTEATPNAEELRDCHSKVASFLNKRDAMLLIYNPWLQCQFRRLFEAQMQEFTRLYEKNPSHVNGHQHMHLATNMLLDEVIPRGTKIRRSLKYEKGEKSLLKRAYRYLVDRRVTKLYRVVDSTYSLTEAAASGKLESICRMARSQNMELITHPVISTEYSILTSVEFVNLLSELPKGGFSSI